MTGLIIQGFILTKKIWVRNFFERLHKSGGATKEINFRAKANLGRGNQRSIKKEASRLMRQRIGTISREVRQQEQRCRTLTARVEYSFTSPQARQSFRDIKRREASRVWEVEKSLKTKKLEDMKPKLPEELNGVLLSDAKLKDAFGDPVVQVTVLGGIQPSDNIKAFLRLPLKFRTFAKPSRDDIIVQTEGRAARQRWIIRDKNANGDEDFDQYRRRKERQEDLKQPLRGNNVDFTNIPVTQLLCNKFVHLPAPAAEEQEIRMGGEKIQLLDAWDLYMRSNLDNDGKLTDSNNLTRSEALGRKEISEGIKSRNWLLYGTDKSGKLVLDTRENFLECMKPHYEEDQIVGYDSVLRSESTLNNHSRAWAKLLNLGLNAGDGQPQRIREALIVKNSNVSHLKGLRKDHKAATDPVKGPPLRPLADGKVGPNAPLANLMARILRPVREGMHHIIPTEILSTEEALHLIQEFNSEVNHYPRMQHSRSCKVPDIHTSNVQVGSMDVAALYPNCKIGPTCKKIEECVNKCGLEFRNINLDFLTKFVSILTKGNTDNLRLNNFLQIPKNRTTLNSFIKRQAENQFQGPALEHHRNLSSDQVRCLLAIAVAKSTEVVMSNHYYQIGGNIHKQTEGSSIGVDLSVETASLYMTTWDNAFLSKLRKLGIKIDTYFRYVDDIVIIMKGINHGWCFSAADKKMIYHHDRLPTLPEDQHTFEQLRLIANTLDINIQMTVDTPSLHQSGRLPVLDLGLYVSDNHIKSGFFSKPMTSPYQIHFRSAIPSRTKRDTLLQEGIRRLRNMGPNTENLEKEAVMSKYMNSLRVSGYDLKYRYHMIRGILNRQAQLEAEFVGGTKVRYRSRIQIREMKLQKIGKYPNTWFLRGMNQNTLKVHATPGSGLLDALKTTLSGRVCTEGGATKFVELGGKTITSGLSGSENFIANKGCVFQPPCNIDPESDCRVNRVVYETECVTCLEDPGQTSRPVYIGTSGHLLHKRQMEHIGEIRQGRRSNALFKHHTNLHQNLVPNFRSRPIQGGIKFNVDRFITEGHQIQKASLDQNILVMNSRSEWGHRGLPRLQVNAN